MTVQLGLALWFLLSVPASVVVGAILSTDDRVRAGSLLIEGTDLVRVTADGHIVERTSLVATR